MTIPGVEQVDWVKVLAAWLVVEQIIAGSGALKSNSTLQAVCNVVDSVITLVKALGKKPAAGAVVTGLLMVGLLGGCATTSGKTDPPEIVAGKSLLAIQQEIVAIRGAIGQPCQSGILSPKVCVAMDTIYQKSKPAYDAAVDAEVLALDTNATPAQTEAAATTRADLVVLLADLSKLAADNGITTSGGN